MAPCTEYDYVTSELAYRRARIASGWAAAHAGARHSGGLRARRRLRSLRPAWS